MKITREWKHLYERMRWWISDKDVWNLWEHIDEIILLGLIKFKGSANSYPAALREMEWEEIMDEMIDGYTLLSEWKSVKEAVAGMEEYFYTEEEKKKIDRAEKLFIKWKESLWW